MGDEILAFLRKTWPYGEGLMLDIEKTADAVLVVDTLDGLTEQAGC